MRIDATTSDFRAAFMAVKENSLFAPVALRIEDLQDQLGIVNMDRAVLRDQLAKTNEAQTIAKCMVKTNGGPIDAEDTDDGKAYVMVLREEFDALCKALGMVGDVE
jgi:hypothetical protein